MHKIAKYPLYPGIHSMANIQTIINKRVWDSLSDSEKAAMETLTYSVWASMLRDSRLDGLDQVAKDKAAGDLEIIDWSTVERKKFREIAVAAWYDFAGKSPLAKEALDSNLSYMRKIGLID